MSIPMLRSCLKFLRGRLRDGFACAVRERVRAKQDGDEVGKRRACKLFSVIPVLLLHRPRSTGSLGRSRFVQQWPVDVIDQRRGCSTRSRVPSHFSCHRGGGAGKTGQGSTGQDPEGASVLCSSGVDWSSVGTKDGGYVLDAARKAPQGPDQGNFRRGFALRPEHAVQ